MTQLQTEVTRERLFDEFNSVVKETSELLKSLAAAGTDKAGAVRTSVELGLAAAGDRLAKIREQSVAQANAAVAATDRYVRDSPWRALGLVAAASAIAGLAAGLCMGRGSAPR